MSNEHKTPLKAVAKPTEMAKVTKPEPIYVSTQERKAFSVERAPNGWSFVTVTYTDDGVVKGIEKTQADVKPITLEKFKLAALRYWSNIG